MSGTVAKGGGGRDWNGRAAREERKVQSQAMWARRERCRTLSRPGSAEVARMVAEFLARGGTVTACPPACVVPVQNGDGLAAPPMRDRSGPGAGSKEGHEPTPGTDCDGKEPSEVSAWRSLDAVGAAEPVLGGPPPDYEGFGMWLRPAPDTIGGAGAAAEEEPPTGAAPAVQEV